MHSIKGMMRAGLQRTILALKPRDPARTRGAAGFALVETLIAVALCALVGLGLVTTVVTARHVAEYDKQRMAAMAAARRFIEERARHDLFPTLDPISDVTLDNFNTPDIADDLRANLTMKLYQVENDGSRGAELTSAPTTDEVVEVEVTVSWNRMGSLSSHRVSESLRTYAAPDL